MAVGLAVGLGANAADEQSGIALSKDHLRRAQTTRFPATTPAPSPTTSAAATPEGTVEASAGAPEATPAPADEHPDSPFTFIDHATALAIYQGDAYLYGEDIFIDARDDAHYTEGHIPGAYQLDHYRADRYLPDLLPICRSALRIVVYCNGGSCEDSQLAAEDLMLEGIDPSKILVYEAGITEWRAQGLPLEVGERSSGKYINGE
ncbi:MAG TPA: rhodanese-like domain-containing protein [Phycisphaerae bacterium]|nr:rhodanese-like domain-containing protein [Phycisphaerae bacterium]